MWHRTTMHLGLPITNLYRSISIILFIKQRTLLYSFRETLQKFPKRLVHGELAYNPIRIQALWAGKLSAGIDVASLNDLLRSCFGASRLFSSSRSSSLSASPTSSSSWSSSLPSSSSSSDGPGVEHRDTDGDVGADTVFCTRPNTICSNNRASYGPRILRILHTICKTAMWFSGGSRGWGNPAMATHPVTQNKLWVCYN